MPVNILTPGWPVVASFLLQNRKEQQAKFKKIYFLQKIAERKISLQLHYLLLNLPNSIIINQLRKNDQLEGEKKSKNIFSINFN